MDKNYMELIKQASGDAWLLFKAYIGIKNNDDAEWEQYIADGNKIIRKYEGTEAENYIRNYVSNVVTPEIERLSRRK